MDFSTRAESILACANCYLIQVLMYEIRSREGTEEGSIEAV